MTIIASTVKFGIMAYSANTQLDSLDSSDADVADLYEQERLKSSTTDPQPQDASEYALIILSAVLFGLGFLVSSATAPLSSNSNTYVCLLTDMTVLHLSLVRSGLAVDLTLCALM